MNLILVPAYTNQALFSDHHLEARLPGTALWQRWTQAELASIHGRIKASLDAYARRRQPKNEEDTRQWLDEVLAILGHAYHREAGSATGRPDYVLFDDASTLEAAAQALRSKETGAYYAQALTVLEAKYWERPLQSRDAEGHRENPVLQINRYLDDAAIHSGNRIQWAVLTNGRHWRLYWRGAPSRALTHYEVDLPELLEHPHLEAGDFARFRYFLLFFDREAFRRDAAGKTRLDQIREASETFATEVGASLEEAIYGASGAFLRLAEGLFRDATQHGVKTLEESPLRDLRALEANTLVLLYRLLFLLYAEDRSLLPLANPEYQAASLSALRDLAATAVDQGKVPTSRRAAAWGHLEGLFDLVHRGDPGMGLPYYNGGLFDPERHPLLQQLKVPDAQLLPALDALSRVVMEGQRRRVDFRDLGVRQLGSLYEGLLEYRLNLAGGGLSISQDSLVRRTTASYYTHESLVARLVADTLNPILEARCQAADEALRPWAATFSAPAKGLAQRVKQEKIREEHEAQVVELLLDLKVLDPAMGSGHFLVAALDHLTDGLMLTLSRHQEDPDLAPWLAQHPIFRTLETQRAAIARSLVDQGLSTEAVEAILPHLDDLRLLKRLVMKRCLFGVDLNPMAVELAKLSLWLDSFTLGAPLSFLDHHLKAGNSLVGSSMAEYTELRRDAQGATIGAGLFAESHAFDPDEVLDELQHLLAISDATRDQVRQSQVLYQSVERQLAFTRLTLDVVASRAFSNPPRRLSRGRSGVVVDDAAVLLADDGALKRLYQLIHEGREQVGRLPEALRLVALNVLEDRQRHTFFHWDLAFPEVFLNKGEHGFDAVLTNPPWERIKLQENEFFGQHRPELARLQTAAQRRAAIQRLRTEDPTLWEAYEAARTVREALLDYAHQSGKYPLLGRGDTNLYALMVERGLSLLKPEGRAGFVVPSGLTTDFGNAPFFGQMVRDRRLAFLYDFENRQGLFPSVDSRFKFSLVGFTGAGASAAQIPAAFFLHDAAQLEAQRLKLDPADFTLMNPNTLTCPVFRSEADYALTRRIYQRVPVLRRLEPLEDPWGIRYQRMFHMTNDSGLFRTVADLEALGAWREAGPMPIWDSPEGRFVPLLEGKMVQAFDPRAAGVRINPENIHRPAIAEATTEIQWADPNHFPIPQYWVSEQAVNERLEPQIAWSIAFKDVTSPTNMRTMIAAAVPRTAAGNKLPFLLSVQQASLQLCLLANLNAVVFDFITRQKLGGQTLNLYIVEQLPMRPPAFYNQLHHGHRWLDLIAPRALELSYTCHALKPLAEACGHEGAPFAWDPARRRLLRAQLDALFFLAYGFDQPEDEAAVAHILGTFPILTQDDPAYAALVQGHLRAYRAGRMDARVEG
jgi:hypothetical protein